MNRREFQQLALVRLAEAKVLLGVKLWDGSYYLAGYSIECGLKACISRGTSKFDFPDKRLADASYTHNLKNLVKAANLDIALGEEVSANAAFRANWDVVQQWSEHSRNNRYESSTAIALVNAVGDVKQGVLPWIKRRW